MRATVVETLNQVKKERTTLRWEKTSCHQCAAHDSHLVMGVLGYDPLQMLQHFYLCDEEMKRSILWLIKHLIKVGARVDHDGQRWYVHVASGSSVLIAPSVAFLK